MVKPWINHSHLQRGMFSLWRQQVLEGFKLRQKWLLAGNDVKGIPSLAGRLEEINFKVSSKSKSLK